jgi:hypothetical protein
MEASASHIVQDERPFMKFRVIGFTLYYGGWIYNAVSGMKVFRQSPRLINPMTIHAMPFFKIYHKLLHKKNRLLHEVLLAILSQQAWFGLRRDQPIHASA